MTHVVKGNIVNILDFWSRFDASLGEDAESDDTNTANVA